MNYAEYYALRMWVIGFVVSDVQSSTPVTGLFWMYIGEVMGKCAVFGSPLFLRFWTSA